MDSGFWGCYGRRWNIPIVWTYLDVASVCVCVMRENEKWVWLGSLCFDRFFSLVFFFTACLTGFS